MNKIKISNIQYTLLTSSLVYGTAPLILPSSVAILSKQDAWISVIFATLIGLLILWINTCLAEMHPNKTIIEIIELLFGKWFGGFVCINFILLCILTASQIVWYIGDFFTTMYMLTTSPYYINMLFMITIAIALLYGLEAIARTTEILFIFIFPTFIIAMIFLIPESKLDNLLPILENGILPIIKGTVPFISIGVLPVLLINMIYTVNAQNTKKAKKSIFIGYLLGTTSLFISILMCILVLGSNYTAYSRFPLFTLSKEINIGVVFSRLEPIMLLVWLATIWGSTMLYFYTAVLGISQLLKLKNYKKIVLPLGLIVTVLSGFIYDDVVYEIYWDNYVWPPYIFTFGFALPLLLLSVSHIKKRLHHT